jgi:hypothetical protein
MLESMSLKRSMHSSGRTLSVLLRAPCFSAFLRTAALPAEVFGPVDLFAFARFACSFFSEVGLRISISGFRGTFVPKCWVGWARTSRNAETAVAQGALFPKGAECERAELFARNILMIAPAK